LEKIIPIFGNAFVKSGACLLEKFTQQTSGSLARNAPRYPFSNFPAFDSLNIA